MITPDKVLSVLRMKGPSLPAQIKKALGEGDTFIVGAVLTELTRSGKVSISNTRRGGSPFYYVPEHRSRLANFIDDLGEKDRRTAELLKSKKVVRDKSQDPLVRVSLRQIKDFAVPIEVNKNGEKELFWKWFEVPNSEAENLVKQSLGIVEKSATPVSKPQKAVSAASSSASSPVIEEKKPVEESVVEEKNIPDVKEKDESQQTLATPKPASKIDAGGDAFLEEILSYFADKHIQIITKNVIRKNSDIEFELSVPSAVGRVEYFCKAKSKKKNNDGDLSGAYVQGQMKRLPVMYLTTGDVTKKAKQKIKTDFKGLVLVELE